MFPPPPSFSRSIHNILRKVFLEEAIKAATWDFFFYEQTNENPPKITLKPTIPSVSMANDVVQRPLLVLFLSTNISLKCSLAQDLPKPPDFILIFVFLFFFCKWRISWNLAQFTSEPMSGPGGSEELRTAWLALPIICSDPWTRLKRRVCTSCRLFTCQTLPFLIFLSCCHLSQDISCEKIKAVNLAARVTSGWI